MEVAHMLIVQFSSAVAMVSSFIALFLIYKAYRHYTKGPVKRAMGHFAIQIAIFCIALVFMVVYHVWDIGLAENLWHYSIMAAMLLGVYAYISFIRLNKMFLYNK